MLLEGRDSYPSTPVPFALTSQPLMAILKQKTTLGLLRGIPLNEEGDKQVLYQLFANDTCLFLELMDANFQEAREAFKLYERVCGAKLNLEKSTVVMMDESLPPDWIH